MKALTSLAMILALSLVIARASFEQNLREREVIVPGSIAAPRAAGPTTMLLFDLAMCLPAMLVLTRGVFDREYRLTFKTSHVLFASIAILAAISSFWASDKFAAAVTSANFIAAAAILWAMTQLVRSWVQLRLVAAACFAVLLVYSAKGTIYRLVEVPDLVKYFEQHRGEVLQQRGYEPGSFAAEQYERKLRSGELFGFNTSPNTFAAMIVMLGVVGAGAAIQRIADRDEPGWAAAIVVGLLIATVIACFTYSKTAAGTPILAAAMIAAAPMMARRRRFSYIAGIAVVLIGTGLLVGHGLAHGSLVIKSLTFRWYYWIGAMRVFLRHPLAGVGWASFGEYYLGVRVPQATEEIQDPHNFVLRAFVELGTIGGILMLAWLAQVCWEMTKPGSSLPQNLPDHKIDERSKPFAIIVWICFAAFALSAVASIEFALDVGYVAIELLQRSLFLALMILGFAVIVLRSSRQPQLDDRPAPWLLRAMVAAVGVFFIHNLLDFSLFEPGPMCMFAMLVGTVIGARYEANPSQSRAIAGIGLILCIVLWCGAAIGIAAPIAQAESTAQQANDEIRENRIGVASAHLQDAFRQLWIPNSDYAFRAAVAMQQAGMLDDAIKMLSAAIAADPMRAPSYRALADFELRRPAPDAGIVLANYEKAAALDPNDVTLHRDFAAALARFGQRQRAIEQYHLMLQYNDAFPLDEPKRMSAAQVQSIQEQIAKLGG